MPVDKDKIRNILETDAFKRSEIRSLVNERDLDVNRNDSSEMIDALVTVNWDEDDLERLKNRFAELQKLDSPFGYYVGEITEVRDRTPQPDHEEVKHNLLTEEAKYDGDELVRGGFDIQECTPEMVKGLYWTRTETYDLDALGKIRYTERTYDFGFELLLEEGIAHVIGDNYGKMGELLKTLEGLGIKIESVGHESKLQEQANNLVEEFVEELSHDLREVHPQRSLDEYDVEIPAPSLLDIDEVHIKITDGELKTAKLTGDQDIYENDTVQELVNEKDGRITRMKGDMIHKDYDFSFNVGYTDRLGRVRVESKDRSATVEDLENAFDFLYDHYLGYFVEI